MKACCAVVIGHVDHGKTALVRALTGMDTDRLAEEKRRGLSITPGFAHCTFQSGVVDLIDAPGHADFIRAMVSAASGSQAALLVVSTVEGIGAQTLQHLQIAGLLGIAQGVVALTKSDLASPQDIAARQIEIQHMLANTPLHSAPILPCSALNGAGIEALKDALHHMLTDASPKGGPPGAALPIDRAFSVPGQGTVVTGTLLGGALRVSSMAVLEPGNTPVRLRGLQARGVACDIGQPGTRVAANLGGVAVADVQPGSMLSTSKHIAASTVFDVDLTLLPEAPALKHMSKLRVLFGTQAAVATLRLIGRGGQALPAGGQSFAQLRFDTPVAGYAGQRAVLRSLSPAQTLGGAVVLDPQARQIRGKDPYREAILHSAQQGSARALARALSAASNGVAQINDVARLARVDIDALWQRLRDDFLQLSPEIITAKEQAAQAEQALRAAVEHYHAQHPLRPVAPLRDLVLADIHPALLNHALATTQQAGTLHRTAERVALTTHDPMDHLTAEQTTRMAQIEALFRAGGVTPPSLNDATQTPDDTDLLALLVAQARLVQLHNVALNQTLVFHPDALQGAAQDLHHAFPAPHWFKTGEARTALGTSRKFIVPLLEHFDDTGLTRRAGDLRQMTPKPV